MVLIQVDLNDQENETLNMYRLAYNLHNRPDAIKHIINSQRNKIEKIKENSKKNIEEAEEESKDIDEKFEDALDGRLVRETE